MSTKVKTLGNTKDKLIKLRTCNLACGEERLIFSLPEPRSTAVTASSVHKLLIFPAGLPARVHLRLCVWKQNWRVKWVRRGIIILNGAIKDIISHFNLISKSRLSSGGLKAKKNYSFWRQRFLSIKSRPHPEKETVSSWPYFQQNKKNLEVCWCKCNSKLS